VGLDVSVDFHVINGLEIRRGINQCDTTNLQWWRNKLFVSWSTTTLKRIWEYSV